MVAGDFFRSAASAIESGHLGIFKIAPEMPESDRRSLLTIQNVVRLHMSGYIYLEVGSALGGSLFPHLADPACRLAYSIDTRPASMPDERGRSFDYQHASTAKMLANLQQNLPLAAMLKLQIFELNATQLTAEHIACQCDLIFIDAEHTNVAVFQDFMSTFRFAKPNAVIAFHDANLLFDGLMNIECFLRHQGIRHRGFVLPDTIYVLLLGDFVDLAANPLTRLAVDKVAFSDAAKRHLWRQIAHNMQAPTA